MNVKRTENSSFFIENCIVNTICDTQRQSQMCLDSITDSFFFDFNSKETNFPIFTNKFQGKA